MPFVGTAYTRTYIRTVHGWFSKEKARQWLFKCRVRLTDA